MQIPARIILGALLLAIMGQVHAFPRPQKTAPNGVPIMYIEQPNATGLSYNRLDSFNVDPKGLIINNWIADSAPPWNSYNRHSQLGGTILANWKLRQKSARVILNEVTGSTPSQLLGPIEIAGDKADLIIANPNGLVIDGARFINIGRMTLSTGRPTFNTNGSLQTLNVTGGDITINGDRFDTKGADSFDLYAQALKMNGKLYAHALSLRLGSQSIDYSSGTASPNGQPNPRLMLLDSSRLGGMYADRITLVGSGAGLGVMMPLEVVAIQGDIQISVEGKIHFPNHGGPPNGALDSVGNLTLQAPSIDLPPSVRVYGDAQIIASDDLNIYGGVFDGDLRLEAAELHSHGMISAKGDVELQVERRMSYHTHSSIYADGNMRITTSTARIRLPSKTRSDECGYHCEDVETITADIMRRADARAACQHDSDACQHDSDALVIENLETLSNIWVKNGGSNFHRGAISLIPRVTDNAPPDLVVLTTQKVVLYRNEPGGVDSNGIETSDAKKVHRGSIITTNIKDYLGYDQLKDLPMLPPLLDLN